MKYLKTYFKRHVIIRYASLLIGMIMFLVLLAQYILKQSYTQQLQDNILQSEKKSMDNMSLNLDAQIKPYLNILYDAATDPNLLSYAASMKHGRVLSSNERVKVHEFLKKKVMYSNKILMLMVIGENGERIAYNKMDWMVQNQLKGFLEYEDAKALFENVKESGMVQVSYAGESKESKTVIHVGVPLIGNRMAKENVFSIVAASLDLDFLYDFFSKNSSDHVENYLVDQNGKILMCREPGWIGDSFEETVSSDEQIVLEKEVNALGWMLYSKINQAQILENSLETTSKVSMLYMVLICFITVFTIGALRYITGPLRTLVKTMKDIGKGDLKIRMEVRGQDEIWQVVEKFNTMMEKLENYYKVNNQQYQRMLEIQKQQQEAEFEVLESYINSHFIFNTLNVINYQVMEAGNQNASVMIKRLSNIMRYAFNSRLQYIYLYQEMLWVEQYLFLQSECDGRKFRFEVLVDERIADCAFRKMILQPFVENSIIHGLKGKENGRILVKADGMEDGKVRILIGDNGYGIPEEKLCNLRRRLEKPEESDSCEGIGMINVVTRLKYYFGERMEFSLESEENLGTRIQILIPYRKLEKQEETGGKQI